MKFYIYFNIDNMEAESESSYFTTLPSEVFLHICSYLQVRDLVLNLSRVCKRFRDILSDESIWKSLIAKRWNSFIPIESNHFNWRRTCFDIERQWKLWKSRDETINCIIVNNVHFSCVDAIVFINSGSTCISGSRDRSIVVWNPIKKTGQYPNHFQKEAAHKGWIWRLRYSRSTLYSCSWDSTVKVWSIDAADIQQKASFTCASSVLSLTLFEGLVLAGDFAKSVYAFDPRCKPEPVFSYVPHRRAVLTLSSTSTDIISGSEDRTVAIWDSRTRSVKQKFSLGKVRFPSSSFMIEDSLYVGDSKGTVHAFTSQDGSMKIVTSLNLGHQKPISVIKRGRGYLVTGSLDGTVKISLPTKQPKILSSITTKRGEVCGLDYCNGILAVGAASYVEFWLPKDHIQY